MTNVKSYPVEGGDIVITTEFIPHNRPIVIDGPWEGKVMPLHTPPCFEIAYFRSPYPIWKQDEWKQDDFISAELPIIRLIYEKHQTRFGTRLKAVYLLTEQSYKDYIQYRSSEQTR